MREVSGALAALALGAVLAAGAGASSQRMATIEAGFTPTAAGSAAAVDLHMTWADPGEQYGKPQQVHRLVLAFPAGTRIDSAALPRCGATDKQIRAKGPSACPRNTRLGGGQSVGTSGTFQLHPDVVLINARRQIIVVVIVDKTVFAIYRDVVTRSTVTVNFKLPAVISLLDLRIHIPVHRSGRRAYFRTPDACPASGFWTMTATSSYADGAVQQAQAQAACVPAVTATSH